MSRANRIRMFALLAAGTLVAPAYAGDPTVGRFYKEIARVRHMAAVDAASAEANLRAAGFRLVALPLDKELTEADVTAISHAMGIGVTTQRPSQRFGERQLSVFLTVFGQQLKG